MAYIKRMRFDRVGKNEGCTCDRCGQYIRNIWTVEYTDGVILHFGIDCFEEISNSKLNAYGQKLMKETMKWIESHHESLEAEKAKTAETDIKWQNEQRDKESYWFGRSYDEYHNWMIQEFWPARMKEDEKRLARFSKVNFDR